jgi:hypothetical protein
VYFPASGSDAAQLQTDGLFGVATAGSAMTFDDRGLIIVYGAGSDTPDFPTLTSKGSASLGSASEDALGVLTVYSQVGSSSMVTGLYLSTGGSVNVTSLGSAGSAFAGTVSNVTFVHTDFTTSGNNIMFGNVDPDGCTTAVAAATITSPITAASGFEGDSVPHYHFVLGNRTR